MSTGQGRREPPSVGQDNISTPGATEVGKDFEDMTWGEIEHWLEVRLTDLRGRHLNTAVLLQRQLREFKETLTPTREDGLTGVVLAGAASSDLEKKGFGLDLALYFISSRDRKLKEEEEARQRKLKEKEEARQRKLKEKDEARQRKLKEEEEARQRKLKEEEEARQRKLKEEEVEGDNLLIPEHLRDKRSKVEWNLDQHATDFASSLMEAVATPLLADKEGTVYRVVGDSVYKVDGYAEDDDGTPRCAPVDALDGREVTVVRSHERDEFVKVFDAADEAEAGGEVDDMDMEQDVELLAVGEGNDNKKVKGLEVVFHYDVLKGLQQDEIDTPSLLVRGSTLPLLRRVYHLVSQRIHQRVVLTGTPGIGKSRTLTHLLRRALLEGRTVAFVALKHQQTFLFLPSETRGNRSAPSYRVFRADGCSEVKALSHLDTLALIDCGKKAVVPTVGCGAVFAASPRKEHYHEWLKDGQGVSFIMDPWTMRETLAIRQVLGPTMTPKLLAYKFECFGGCIRYVFGSRLRSTKRITTMREKLTQAQEAISKLDLSMTVDATEPYTPSNSLFAVRAGGIMEPVSDLAAGLMDDYLKSQGVYAQWVARDGVGFEFWMNRFLEQGKPSGAEWDPGFRWIRGTRGNGPQEEGRGPKFESYLPLEKCVGEKVGHNQKAYEAACLTLPFVDGNGRYVCDKKYVTVPKRRLLMPHASNQPVFDSCDAANRVYQITLGKRHTVSTIHFLRYLKKLKAEAKRRNVPVPPLYLIRVVAHAGSAEMRCDVPSTAQVKVPDGPEETKETRVVAEKERVRGEAQRAFVDGRAEQGEFVIPVDKKGVVAYTARIAVEKMLRYYEGHED